MGLLMVHHIGGILVRRATAGRLHGLRLLPDLPGRRLRGRFLRGCFLCGRILRGTFFRHIFRCRFINRRRFHILRLPGEILVFHFIHGIASFGVSFLILPASYEIFMYAGKIDSGCVTMIPCFPHPVKHKSRPPRQITGAGGGWVTSCGRTCSRCTGPWWG